MDFFSYHVLDQMDNSEDFPRVSQEPADTHPPLLQIWLLALSLQQIKQSSCIADSVPPPPPPEKCPGPALPISESAPSTGNVECRQNLTGEELLCSECKSEKKKLSGGGEGHLLACMPWCKHFTPDVVLLKAIRVLGLTRQPQTGERTTPPGAKPLGCQTCSTGFSQTIKLPPSLIFLFPLTYCQVGMEGPSKALSLGSLAKAALPTETLETLKVLVVDAPRMALYFSSAQGGWETSFRSPGARKRVIPQTLAYKLPPFINQDHNFVLSPSIHFVGKESHQEVPPDHNHLPKHVG